MQTKKEEIRETILNAAQKEFLLHGYEGASMRTIAQKANTTLGNIYHYYKNKESILEELLREPICDLKKLIQFHLEENKQIYSLDEFQNALQELDDMIEDSELRYLMDERLLILFDLKTTRFVTDKNHFIAAFKQHMAWHLNIADSDSAYIDIITEMFISCMRHVLLEHKDPEKAKKEFINVFRMLCGGLIINRGEENEYGRTSECK